MPNFLDNAINQHTETLCDWVAKYNTLLNELQAILGGGGEFLLKAGDIVPEDFFIRREEFAPAEWIEMRMKNAMGAEIFLGRNGDDDVQHGLIVNGGNKQIFAVGDAKIGHYGYFGGMRSWQNLEQSEFVSKKTLFDAQLHSDVSGFFDLSPYYRSKKVVLIIDNMTGDLTIGDPRIYDGYELSVYAYQNDAPVYNLTLQTVYEIKYVNNSSLTVSRPNPNELLVPIPQNNYNILIEAQIVDGKMFAKINEYQ